MTTAAQAHAQLLVVDDDPEIAKLVQTYLSQHGFDVDRAINAARARELLERKAYQLAIVDLLMPGEDGLDLTRHIRATYDIGIIILSGQVESIDQVAALETGADDYLTKPVPLRALLARVRSVLRRLAPMPIAGRSQPARLTKFAEWTLDQDRRCLVDADGTDTTLTASEFTLLLAFLNHANRVLDRDQLLDLVRGRDSTPFDRTVDVLVGRLRGKIERDRSKPALIRTIRGAGYMLVADVGVVAV
ncbi:MAG: response regulator transcription factor [Proteobacteria bacterium]|nr:response regulator transcription factor [Pseudomonadota bacterium]MBI3496951.1 response regulator transcription factor [Pseudomonadota bacterium]